MRVVLASASPRRRELLARLGVDVDVRPVDVPEAPLDGEAPEALVLRLAVAKAQAAEVDDDDVVVAADTVVVLDGRAVGKPRDDEDARTVLRALCGRTHDVLSGVAVRRGDRLTSAVERTLVELRHLDDDVIDRYVASGEPRDKAGSYAIQGLAGAFVTRIEGSDTNVVGLPLARTVLLAADLGVDLLASTGEAAGCGVPATRATSPPRRRPGGTLGVVPAAIEPERSAP